MNLIEYLPRYYAASPHMKRYQEVLGWQVEQAWYFYFEMLEQHFANTATWGLSFWEKALGLTSGETRPEDFRRAAVISKLRGQGTTTTAMLQNAIAGFVGKTQIIERPEEYAFNIRFLDVCGRPQNLADISAAIEMIKPAHLAFSYIYRYLLIREVHGAMTIDELQLITLDKFEGGN